MAREDSIILAFYGLPLASEQGHCDIDSLVQSY